MGFQSKSSNAFVNHNLTRRGALGMAAGVAVALHGRGTASARQDASPTSGWSFTDDKGETIELPQTPQRLVADVNAAAPLWDFGVRPVGVFGWNASETGDFGDAGGNIDPSTVEVAGNASEPVQLEKLASLDPDLIITLTWTPDDPIDYWSIQEPLLPQVRNIAPLLAMSATGRADVNTERFAELAAALGADLDTTELADARSGYETTKADFLSTATAKTDLQLLFVAITPEAIWVANPVDWADLNFYLESGVSIIQPDAEPGSFWEQLSHEQALKYPADIIFVSTRPDALGHDELDEHPAFSAHPAVRAGQAVPWNQDFIMSYQGMTEAMEHISSVQNDSEKVI